VVEDTRGFYANRCVHRYINEGYNLLAEGVKPALIENAAKMAGMPVGPLSLQDEVAIDLAYKVMVQTKQDLGSQYVEGKGDKIVEAMYNADRLGRKNGKGFYVYNGREKHLWPELGQFAQNGVLDPQPPTQDVKDRIMYTQAIEAARTMAEGIVHDPREADLGSIFGWGFAPFTGGAISLPSNSSPARMSFWNSMARNLKCPNSYVKWRNQARRFTVNSAVKKTAELTPNMP